MGGVSPLWSNEGGGGVLPGGSHPCGVKGWVHPHEGGEGGSYQGGLILMDFPTQVCKKLSGFLRVAFADPLPEKGYARRGWVTFSSEVNIKDICAKLSNIKVSCQSSITVATCPLTSLHKRSSPDQRPADQLPGEQGA